MGIRPMGQEELDELKRQIGVPQPIAWPPQIKEEDMPTIQEMVRNLDETIEDEEVEDLVDDEE